MDLVTYADSLGRRGQDVRVRLYSVRSLTKTKEVYILDVENYLGNTKWYGLGVERSKVKIRANNLTAWV